MKSPRKRQRYSGPVSAVTAALAAFARTPGFVFYGESKKYKVNKALCTEHGPLLRELSQLAPSLSFKKRTIMDALTEVAVRKKFFAQQSQAKDWVAITTRRLRLMMRHVSQAAIRGRGKQQTWVRLIFPPAPVAAGTAAAAAAPSDGSGAKDLEEAAAPSDGSGAKDLVAADQAADGSGAKDLDVAAAAADQGAPSDGSGAKDLDLAASSGAAAASTDGSGGARVVKRPATRIPKKSQPSDKRLKKEDASASSEAVSVSSSPWQKGTPWSENTLRAVLAEEDDELEEWIAEAKKLSLLEFQQQQQEQRAGQAEDDHEDSIPAAQPMCSPGRRHNDSVGSATGSSSSDESSVSSDDRQETQIDGQQETQIDGQQETQRDDQQETQIGGQQETQVDGQHKTQVDGDVELKVSKNVGREVDDGQALEDNETEKDDQGDGREIEGNETEKDDNGDGRAIEGNETEKDDNGDGRAIKQDDGREIEGNETEKDDNGDGKAIEQGGDLQKDEASSLHVSFSMHSVMT